MYSYTETPYTFYGHCYSKFTLSDCIFFLLNAYIPKIWSPLQKSVQFSSICMRSSQSSPFLLHYRSYTINSLDRCISFCEKGEKMQGQLNFPIFVQQLRYVHYLYYSRHLNAINGVERLRLWNEMGKTILFQYTKSTVKKDI